MANNPNEVFQALIEGLRYTHKLSVQEICARTGIRERTSTASATARSGGRASTRSSGCNDCSGSSWRRLRGRGLDANHDAPLSPSWRLR
jgi:hypothetical protein